MAIYLGMVLALLAALATDVGNLLKHRGASAAPEVSLAHPLGSAVGLCRSKWFRLGTAVGLGAWVLHVGALALAPLSLVQAVMAGGLVFLTVIAERWFGCAIDWRQSVAVGLTALALVLLAITFPHGGGTGAVPSGPGMAASQLLPLALAALLLLAPGLGSCARQGLLLGGVAGILFGASNIGIEALTELVGSDRALGLLALWGLSAAAAGALAFFASARALQQGEAVPVITVTSTAANVSAILGGILALGDPMPTDALGLAAQRLAFALVIAAAAIVPPRQPRTG